MTAQGYYIYLEGSYPAKMNDTARIISNPVSDRNGCFSLWYHMYGADIGSLNTHVQLGNGSIMTLVNIQGNLGNVWRELQVNINESMFGNQSKQFIIQGVVGNGYASQLMTNG